MGTRRQFITVFQPLFRMYAGMKNFIRTFFAVIFFAGVSFGAGPTAFAAGDEGGQGGSNRTVDLSNIVVPVQRDGELINYLFVSAVVTIASGHDQWGARDRAHIIRDGILRAAHRTPVGLEGHPMELNEQRYLDIVRTVVEEEMGEGSVESIEILATDSQLVFIEG